MNVIDLAKKLIEKKSITPQDNGCQKMLIDYLKSLHFTVTEYNHNGVSNFWATHGHGAPLFCFAGHTDVVPPGEESAWQFPPFKPTEKNGLLFGRGAADMKSAIAAMLIATQHFLNDNPNHKGTLAFLITSDEEGPSEFGTKHVISQLNTPIDYCLVGEATSNQQLGDTLKIGRRGSLHGTLKIYGKQGHIAYPEKTKNPIHQAALAINALNRLKWDRGNKHFPPTSLQFYDIQSGIGASNVVPPDLTAKFNFRYNPASSKKSLEAKMNRALKKAKVDFNLTFEKESPGYYSQRGELISACESAIKTHTHIKPTLSTTGGTSDGRFIAKICQEVIELGPINESIHQIDEHICLADLETLCLIYQSILNSLLAPPQ